jgi:hypothetical protein
VGLRAGFGTFEKGKPWLLGFPSHDYTISAALAFVVSLQLLLRQGLCFTNMNKSNI